MTGVGCGFNRRAYRQPGSAGYPAIRWSSRDHCTCNRECLSMATDGPQPIGSEAVCAEVDCHPGASGSRLKRPSHEARLLRARQDHAPSTSIAAAAPTSTAQNTSRSRIGENRCASATPHDTLAMPPSASGMPVPQLTWPAWA